MPVADNTAQLRNLGHQTPGNLTINPVRQQNQGFFRKIRRRIQHHKRMQMQHPRRRKWRRPRNHPLVHQYQPDMEKNIINIAPAPPGTGRRRRIQHWSCSLVSRQTLTGWRRIKPVKKIVEQIIRRLNAILSADRAVHTESLSYGIIMISQKRLEKKRKNRKNYSDFSGFNAYFFQTCSRYTGPLL